MRFSIVLIFIFSLNLTANSRVSGLVNNNPFFYLSKVFSSAVKSIPKLHINRAEDMPSASKAKNSLFLSVSSMVAVGKHVGSLLWKLADAKADGLSGSAKAKEIEDEIDELAILTDGTFLGAIETSSQKTSLKNGVSTGNELQEQTPKKGPKPSNSGGTPSQDAQKSLSFLSSDDDDDDLQASPSLFSNSASSATAAASGSSSNSGGYKTPSNEPSTPRSNSTSSVEISMEPIKTFTDLVQRARPVLKGASQIEKMGLKPLLLHQKHWLEATHSEHPFVGSNHVAGAFNSWQKNPEGSPNFLASPGARSFVKHVEYLDSGTLAQKMIKADSNGNALNSQGVPMTNFSGMIVIGPDGQAYAMPGVEGSLHHSSFLAGGALIWAGEIETDSQGEIIKLTDESGHYQPSSVHNLQGINCLLKLGFNLKQTNFEQQWHPGCGFHGFCRSMSAEQYVELTTQEISNTHASKAQTAPSTAAAASQQTLNETAK